MALPSAKLPTWYRAFAIIVGVVSIALALVVLVEPLLALWLLIFLLGFALLVIGLDRLVAGVTGHPFGWMGPQFLGGAPPSPPGSSTGGPSGPVPPTKP